MKSPKKHKKDIVVTYQYIEPKTEAERIKAERNLEAAYDILFTATIQKMKKELDGDTSMIPEKKLKTYRRVVRWFEIAEQKRRNPLLWTL